jgi:hypothetical protein
MIDRHIGEPFPEVIPVLERWFDGLTHKQLIFWESYWHLYGPPISEREIWEALRRTPERQRVTRRPTVRKEVVVIFGHKVTVFRNLNTGRFSRRRRN